ncbi:hypothetical protein HKK80_06475 [Halonotius sp. F2-221B]
MVRVADEHAVSVPPAARCGGICGETRITLVRVWTPMTTDDETDFSADIVDQREGVFDDFEPVDAGETDAVATEREFGAE